MADPSVLPPFVPPPAPPADLVIDTFGTFLGKRSGRMLLRWREPAAPQRSPLLDHPDPFGPPREEPPAGGAGDARGSAPRANDATPPAPRRPPAVLKFARPSDPQAGVRAESHPSAASAAEAPRTAVDPTPPSSDASDALGIPPVDNIPPNVALQGTTTVDGTSPPLGTNASETQDVEPSGDAPALLTEDSDGSEDRAPDAVAARLLSLWSRRAGTPRSSRSTAPFGKGGASSGSAPGAGFNNVRPGETRTPPPAPGEGDDGSSPHDRFRRLDATLRELEADFDSTPGNAWRHCEVPLDRLKSVVVASRGVTISSDLVEALVERGVQLSFLSSRGLPVAHLNAPALSATVQTRRSQLAAYSTRTGVELAAAFIDGKVRNQRHTLLYFGKYLKATAPDRYRKVFEKAKSMHAMRRTLRELAKSTPRRAAESSLIEVLRDKLMGFEGAAARSYWEAVAVILEGRIAFPGRETRGALDPVNAALNYGYGILYSQVFGAVVNAGLEPYAGFLHVDRPGKPSLVLDLVEEFRAPIVDRAVLAIVNQGIEVRIGEHGLVGETKRLIADRVLERLNKPVPFEGKRHRLRSIVQMQARHLATAVRGERVYKPFCSRW
ncbi:MAG: CRISPR-associated endonuclease Cas1 [Planctomycetaceae bacterium]|nr:CRISPR-associated endonuclease Cas1 [Planctomycetaceae bacterium]